jgi:hypothetical protein
VTLQAPLPAVVTRKPDIILADLGSLADLRAVYEEWTVPSNLNPVTPAFSFLDETISNDLTWRRGPKNATTEEKLLFNNFKNALDKRKVLITAIHSRVDLGEKLVEVIADMEQDRKSEKFTICQYVDSLRPIRQQP